MGLTTETIEACDFWWFRELYGSIAALADEPFQTMSRLGLELSVAEDLAAEFAAWRDRIADKYPEAAELEVVRVADRIAAILDRKGPGGDDFEPWFWTVDAFQIHVEWEEIRQLARSFLLR